MVIKECSFWLMIVNFFITVMTLMVVKHCKFFHYLEVAKCVSSDVGSGLQNLSTNYIWFMRLRSKLFLSYSMSSPQCHETLIGLPRLVASCCNTPNLDCCCRRKIILLYCYLWQLASIVFNFDRVGFMKSQRGWMWLVMRVLLAWAVTTFCALCCFQTRVVTVMKNVSKC